MPCQHPLAVFLIILYSLSRSNLHLNPINLCTAISIYSCQWREYNVNVQQSCKPHWYIFLILYISATSATLTGDSEAQNISDDIHPCLAPIIGPRKVHQNTWSKNTQISHFLSKPFWPIFIRNWHHAFTKPKFYPNFGLLFNRPPNFGYFISIFNFHYFFVFPPLQASLCVLASLRQRFTTAEGR